MNIINLTPHNIQLNTTEITPGGKPIRVKQATDTLYFVHDVPVKMLKLATATSSELPPMLPDTIYIVSRLVADVFRATREDFVFPYDFLRNPVTGYILGCKSLARFESSHD